MRPLTRFIAAVRPRLLSRHVFGVPIGPVGVALAEALFVLAVGSLGTPHRASQVICRAERSHASIDATGQSRRDFLQQPTVAIGIAERSQRAVGAPLRIWTADRTVRTEVEDLANVDARGDDRVAGGFYVGNDQISPLG